MADCRTEVKDKYLELFKKKEEALAKVDPELRKKLANEGVNIEAFKPLTIDQVADEIDHLRQKYKDPLKFEKEARAFIADMQAERVNKKIDFYQKKLHEMDLERQIFTDDAAESVQNFENLFSQLDNRKNFLSSKNYAIISQELDDVDLTVIGSTDPIIVKQIFDAIEGHNLNEIDTNIKDMAGKVKRIYDFLFNQEKDAGFRKGRLHNYAGPREWNPSKLAENPDGALEVLKKIVNVEESFPHLDLRLPDDVTELDRILKKIVNERIESDYNTGLQDVGKMDATLRSSLEARRTRSRKIVFKPGGEGIWASQFGSASVLETLLKQARTVANVSANREIFGPNPMATTQLMLKKMRKKYANEESIARGIKGAVTRQTVKDRIGGSSYLERLWAPHNGKLTKLQGDPKKGQQIATGFNIAKSVIYMARLGATNFSAIVDIPTAAAVMDADLGTGIFKSYSRMIGEAFKDFPLAIKSYVAGEIPKEAQEYAAKLGVFTETGMSSALNRMGIDGLGSRMFHSSLRLFERITPIGMQTTFHDFTAMKVFQNAFVENFKLNKNGFEFNKALKRSGLDSTYNGIIEASIDQLSTEAASVPIFYPGKILELPDEVAKEFQQKIGENIPKVALMSVDEFKKDTANRLQIMFTDFKDNGIPKPGAKQKAALSWGAPGTWLGETLNSLTMLKSFSLKMIDIQERIYGSTPSRGKRMARMGAYATSLTAFGYVAMTLNDIKNNRTPRPLDEVDTYKDAFLKGGAGGIFADMYFSATDLDYNNFTKGLAGPMVGPVEDVAVLSKKAMGTTASLFGADIEKGKKISGKDARRVIRNIPFQNHFLIRPAFDAMFLDNWMKAADPEGYRRRQRSMRQRGQRPLFP